MMPELTIKYLKLLAEMLETKKRLYILNEHDQKDIDKLSLQLSQVSLLIEHHESKNFLPNFNEG